MKAKVINLKIDQIYEISGDVVTNEIKKICTELLTDPLTQEYFVNSTRDKGCFPVEVYNKNGVTDAVADTVEIGIKDIGINKNINVKTGKKFCLYGSLKTSEIEEIAKKILSNSIIQEYKI